jgi:hypothetical protein
VTIFLSNFCVGDKKKAKMEQILELLLLVTTPDMTPGSQFAGRYTFIFQIAVTIILTKGIPFDNEAIHFYI